MNRERDNLMAERLSEKIYKQIKQDIDTGKIDAREFLSESQLAKAFGVSKAPVRDALHLLCNQGYLISYPRKGYMVNVFSNEEINQVQIIRRQIEKLCAQLVIEKATDEEILTLKEFTKSQRATDDPMMTNNTLFHTRMAELSGNKFLPEILRNLLYKVSQAQIKSISDLEKHDHIIEALLARDLSKAEQCLEEDILFL